MTKQEARENARLLEIAADDLTACGRYLVGQEAVDAMRATAQLLRDVAEAEAYCHVAFNRDGEIAYCQYKRDAELTPLYKSPLEQDQ